MAIKDRNLEVGTRLVARYKQQAYLCTVEAGPQGEGLRFRLQGHERPFTSLSAAGSAVMGGKAVNGWRFWSLEGQAQPAGERAPAKPAAEAKPRSGARRGKRLLYLVPNQKGTPEGQQKWFCTACMASFLVGAGEAPQLCPKGHRADDPELTGAVGTPEAQAAEVPA